MINIFVLLRILIGLVYIVSGFEKLITPFQNFQYVIQSYAIVPDSWEIMIAKSFPWIELISGLFILLGLWTRLFLYSAVLMAVTFMIVVSQAIFRQLPISECGCFGELISLPLQGVLVIDATLFLCAIFLIANYQKTILLSLDRHFNE
ncbi:MAG: DoxX family protein [Candidatus Omnitrophota bacterium]